MRAPVVFWKFSQLAKRCVSKDRNCCSRAVASTCLAVLFVPSLFVVVQRFEEWLKARKSPPLAHVPAE
jgi:hypothetical protein